MSDQTLTLTIPWSEVAAAYQKVLRSVAQRVKSPGFRPGKVPPSIAEKMVDSSALYQRALENILPTHLSKAVSDAKISFLGQPELEPITMEFSHDWQFTVHLAGVPQIKLGKYQNVVKKASSDSQKAHQKMAQAAKAHLAESKSHEGHNHDLEELDDVRLRSIFDALIAEIKPEVSELLIKQEVNRDLQRLGQQLDQLKVSIEKYLEIRKQTYEELRAELSATAKRSWQLELTLQAIAQEQKLDTTEADINEYLKKHNIKKATEEERNSLTGPLRRQKVVEWLLSLK